LSYYRHYKKYNDHLVLLLYTTTGGVPWPDFSTKKFSEHFVKPWQLSAVVLEAHGLPKQTIDIIIAGEKQRDNCTDVNAKNIGQYSTDKDKDFLLAGFTLKRRLNDVMAPFSLCKSLYPKLLASGGTISIGTRAPKKVSKVKASLNTANDSKDHQLKTLFGRSASDFDVFLRDLHPMVVAADGWMSNTIYMLSLGNLLDSLRVCTNAELIVYLRYDSIAKRFASSSSFVNEVCFLVLL
jgi:hypothetical protein